MGGGTVRVRTGKVMSRMHVASTALSLASRSSTCSCKAGEERSFVRALASRLSRGVAPDAGQMSREPGRLSQPEPGLLQSEAMETVKF